MQISLDKPELEKFIHEKVRAGDFASPSEVVEAGLARLMLDSKRDELDAQDIADIRESLDQMKRGEVLDWKKESAELRAKRAPK
jgi:Arc/MetJ-type ribon-helix-helix transcriptional regulator